MGSFENIKFIFQFTERDMETFFEYEYVNNARNKVFDTYEEFRSQNLFCDFVIKAGNKRYNCHKLVLAATVPYFETMLSSAFLETSTGEVEFSEHMSESLDIVIHYIYTGSIKITISNITALIEMGSYLGIDSLVDACVMACENGLICKDSVFIIFDAAKGFNVPPLINICNDYINENFDLISETDGFLSIQCDMLISIIESDQQQANEQCIWEAVVRWVKHDPENRNQILPKLMEYVRFDLINPTYLWRNIAKDDLLSSSTQCREFIFEVLGNRLIENDVKGINPSRNRYVVGDVYVMGGVDNIYTSRRVFKYCSQVSQWCENKPMDVGLKLFGAATIKNNIYTVGGYTPNGRTSRVQMFDTIMNIWSTISYLNVSRYALGVCSMYNFIYACGGIDSWDKSINSVELYDSHLDRWVLTTPMNETRGCLGVVCLEGSIWAIGGHDTIKTLNSVERFDPRDGSWSQCSPMLKTRRLHGAAVLGNKIYVCGGNSVEEYDPRNNQWSFLSPMLYERSRFSLVVNAGRIWAIGGKNETVEMYDNRNDVWALGNPLPTRLHAHGAVVVSHSAN